MTTLTTLQDNKKHPPHPMQHFNMHPSMSTITASPPDTNTHYPSKPAHRRRDSGELDVFEAARYFSDGVDCVGLLGGILFQRTMKQQEEEEEEEDKRKLEIAMKRSMQDQEYSSKGKQSPNKSSPGGRLASFVNSLFHQKASKKKSKPIISSHEPKETEDYEAKNSDWINGDDDDKEEEEEEDDGSSDSSSDLFELKSYDLKDMPKLEIIKRKDSIAR